jgi:hypothetical protein
MITSSATVVAGGYLLLTGMVCGDLIVQPGGRATVNGMVEGSVRNDGKVDVCGMVHGRVEGFAKPSSMPTPPSWGAPSCDRSTKRSALGPPTPASLPSQTVTNYAELDAILEQVEAAGLVEQYVDEEGKQAMRLTPEGVRVARLLTMLGEDGQDELMAALLGE